MWHCYLIFTTTLFIQHLLRLWLYVGFMETQSLTPEQAATAMKNSFNRKKPSTEPGSHGGGSSADGWLRRRRGDKEGERTGRGNQTQTAYTLKMLTKDQARQWGPEVIYAPFIALLIAEKQMLKVKFSHFMCMDWSQCFVHIHNHIKLLLKYQNQNKTYNVLHMYVNVALFQGGCYAFLL